MAGNKQHLIELSHSLILKLWILAIIGLILPTLVKQFWPDGSWVGEASRSHAKSIKAGAWQDPWEPIGEDPNAAWIRCPSLEDAIALDERIDDGQPHTGRLILTPGGVAWRAQ
jgi:hypothetical protein